MNNYLNGLRICALALLIGLGFSTLKGIFWSDKDICNVSSNKSNGKSFINENRVKFLPDRVIGTFWTDFYISEKGNYVYDFTENNTKETIEYKVLPDKYITEFDLFPSYTWWQSNGVYVILGIGLILSFFGEDFWKLIFTLIDDAF